MGEADFKIEPAIKIERKVLVQPAWARVYDQLAGSYNGGRGGELYDSICQATEKRIIANTGKQIDTFGYVVHEDDMCIGTFYAVNDNSGRQWDGWNFPIREATEIDLSDQKKVDLLLALAQAANELDWKYKSDGKTGTAKICSDLRLQVGLILFRYATGYNDTVLLQTVQNLGRRPGGEVEIPREVVKVPAEAIVPDKVVADDIDIEEIPSVEQTPVELPPPPLAEKIGGSGGDLGEVSETELKPDEGDKVGQKDGLDGGDGEIVLPINESGSVEEDVGVEPVEKREKKLVRPASRSQRWKHVTVDRLSPKILPEITTTEW